MSGLRAAARSGRHLAPGPGRRAVGARRHADAGAGGMVGIAGDTLRADGIGARPLAKPAPRGAGPPRGGAPAAAARARTGAAPAHARLPVLSRAHGSARPTTPAARAGDPPDDRPPVAHRPRPARASPAP